MDTHKINEIGNAFVDTAISGLLIGLVTKGEDKALAQFENVLINMLDSAFNSNELPEQVKQAMRDRIYNQMQIARTVGQAARP
ncbi:hypothetical protein A7P25_22000 [Achromobacter xylosoxidans]|nr:hypothetical protein A7P25_22000 [Achromobacter xylosoxidans]